MIFSIKVCCGLMKSVIKVSIASNYNHMSEAFSSKCKEDPYSMTSTTNVRKTQWAQMILKIRILPHPCTDEGKSQIQDIKFDKDIKRIIVVNTWHITTTLFDQTHPITAVVEWLWTIV